MPERKPDDLLTARQISEQYGIPLVTAESLLKQRDKEGLVVRWDGFRRRFIRRADINPERQPVRRQSGGTT